MSDFEGPQTDDSKCTVWQLSGEGLRESVLDKYPRGGYDLNHDLITGEWCTNSPELVAWCRAQGFTVTGWHLLEDMRHAIGAKGPGASSVKVVHPDILPFLGGEE